MKRQRLRRHERKHNIDIAVNALGRRVNRDMTMTEIARHVGLEPSTYVMELLQELFRAGNVSRTTCTDRDGRCRYFFRSNIPF